MADDEIGEYKDTPDNKNDHKIALPTINKDTVDICSGTSASIKASVKKEISYKNSYIQMNSLL